MRVYHRIYVKSSIIDQMLITKSQMFNRKKDLKRKDCGSQTLRSFSRRLSKPTKRTEFQENISFLRKHKQRSQDAQEASLTQILKIDQHVKPLSKLNQTVLQPDKQPSSIMTLNLKKRIKHIFRKQDNWIEQNKIKINPLVCLTNRSLQTPRIQLTNISRLKPTKNSRVLEQLSKITNPSVEQHTQPTQFEQYDPYSQGQRLHSILNKTPRNTHHPTLVQNNILKMQRATKLTRYQLHSYYSYYRALMQDCLVDSRGIKAIINVDKFLKGLSIILKMPLSVVENALKTIESQNDSVHFDFSDFTSFAMLVSSIRQHSHLTQNFDSEFS